MTLDGRDRYLVGAVFVIALLQPIGYLCDIPPVRGLGLVSVASPLPLVFSAHDGLETFAQTYAVDLSYTGDEPKTTRVDVSPALYSRLDGAYNRRNTYGAIFSHGPILARGEHRALIDEVVRYGFCGDGPLLTTFDLSLQPDRVRIESRPSNNEQPLWHYEVACP